MKTARAVPSTLIKFIVLAIATFANASHRNELAVHNHVMLLWLAGIAATATLTAAIFIAASAHSVTVFADI